MKSKDFATTGSRMSDIHYHTEPDIKEFKKCYYCGNKVVVEELIEHKEVLICRECKEE